MSAAKDIQPSGEKMRKAVKWLSDMTQNCPGKSRQEIIREAEIRFDLSPKESHFLSSKFGGSEEEEST